MAPSMAVFSLLSATLVVSLVHGGLIPTNSGMGMLVVPIGNGEEPARPVVIIPVVLGHQRPMMPKPMMMPMMPKPMMMPMMPRPMSPKPAMMKYPISQNMMPAQPQQIERPEIKTDARGRQTLEF
ncbi:uncharacterized protein LOC125664754 [Ostrea edulis]|uniref:uncharacterized protein LOC125664754 n=1 Tax=Ostrea edulis TaxID=37623 RepID=UPI002094A73E|nr:uncharacterized protein LOC125664754 [Ostrea edulis]